MTSYNYKLKHFIYTGIIFLVLCLLSYAVNAQDLPLKLSMKDAASLALQHNRDIKTAQLGVDQSQQQIRIAQSMRLPTVAATGQVSHYFLQPAFFGFGSNGATGKIPYGRFGGKDQALAALSVVQPLYNPAAKASLAHAKLLQEESRLQLTDKENEMASFVQLTYLQLLVLQERVNLQKESLNRNKKALQDTRSLLTQGKALRVDTLRAYTSVKNLEPDLLKLSNAIEVNQLQLKVLIGLDSLKDILLTDSLTLPQPAESVPTEEAVFNEAKTKRADLKAVALQQAVYDQQIALARSANKPGVSLIGQYQLQTQATKFDYVNAFYPSTALIGAQVTVPIFNGHSIEAKIQQAKTGRQQAIIQTDNAYAHLKVEVKQVVAALHETIARMQTRTTVKETAQLSYDMVQYRYAKGVASRLELTDAELALTAAQSNYLEAVYDYLSARIMLDRTTGRQVYQ